MAEKTLCEVGSVVVALTTETWFSFHKGAVLVRAGDTGWVTDMDAETRGDVVITMANTMAKLPFAFFPEDDFKVILV